MRILLIDPPFKIFTGFVNYYFPLGLTYLAAMLKNAGYKTSIFDVDAMRKRVDIDFSDEYRRMELYIQGLNNDDHNVWQQMRVMLDDFEPDIVGITAVTTKFGSVLKTAELVKKYDSKCKVIIGGPHATLLPEQALKSDNIDIVVRGEGEKTFFSLIKAIEGNDNIQSVKGISFKINGKIFHAPSCELIKSLDEVPFPDRESLMNFENYSSEDLGMIMASRGCPFSCSYCCHPWGQRVRYRSVSNVIEEINQVKMKYKTRQFEFKDDTFTINQKWVKEFCGRLISESININWGCTTRVDVLQEEMIKLMKRSGCNIIKLGIETGSEHILKETRKEITFKQAKEAADLLNKHNIFWSAYFMMGFPTETEEDIKKTYEFMKELNPYYAGLGVYNPFPKTELFELGVKKGLLYPEVDLRHFFTTNPKDYFFISERRVISIDREKFNKLVVFMIGCFHWHNVRIGNIMRRGWARRFVYIQDPKLMFRDINLALRWWLGA